MSSRAGRKPQLLSRTPEVGMTATAATAATKVPVSMRRSLAKPSWESVQPTTAKGPVSWGQLPRESKWHTSGCCNFLPASATEGSLRTS